MYQAQRVFALLLVCLLKDFFSLFVHFGRNSILSLSARPYFVWCQKPLAHDWALHDYSMLRLIFVSYGKKNAFCYIRDILNFKMIKIQINFLYFLLLYKLIDILQYLERCIICEKVQSCFSQKILCCTWIHILTAFLKNWFSFYKDITCL